MPTALATKATKVTKAHTQSSSSPQETEAKVVSREKGHAKASAKGKSSAKSSNQATRSKGQPDARETKVQIRARASFQGPADARVEELVHRIIPSAIPAEQFPTRPERVGIIASVDHDGEEAFFIDLIFPDVTREEMLRWVALTPLVRWVQDQAREVDAGRFPYVRVARHSAWMADSAWKTTWPPPR